MADTTTPVYSFVLPEVDGSDGTWGTKLNANLTALDGLLSGSTNLQNASFTGTVSFGGSTGTAGQVLKSQGAGANAIWTDDTDTTYTAGSGLSLTGTEFANTAPDQTVVMTGSGATSVSGTYPSFTIASTNTTYSVGDGGLTEINFTSADNTKLDGIEASADVTDTTNVTAAGALMDSEVTNLAQVKAFDSSDYATASQGTTADNALPKSGGAMTGAITTNSTFDGRDVATDGTKLDGIEASADVTDTANVTAAGALMDSELTSEASVKALNQGVATTDSPSFVNLTLSGTGSVKVPSGTTAQRDGSPANGMFRYNSTNEQFEGYQSGAWGAIGGGGGSNTFTADTFTGNGSTTAYALSQVVNSEDNLLVFIAGVFQQQSAYSIATASGTTTLTFATAPANTREIIVYSVASAVSGSNLNIDSMTGDGSDTTLSLTINPVNENNTQVFIDGVYQNKDTYSISGTTLTFSTAPPTGSAVEVMTMTQTEINVPVDGTITPAKIASGDFYFDTNTLYVDSTNNNVGVGTSSPNTGSGTNLSISSDVTTRLLLENTATNGKEWGIYSGSSGVLGFYDYSSSSERLRILSTGGITFNGDTAQANALDDYEEGTWTPAFSSTFTEGSFNSATGFSSIDGQYTKVGNLVTCIAEFKVTGASGNLSNGDNFSITYSSLPFSVLTSSNQLCAFGGTITAYGAVGSGSNAGGNFIALNSQPVFVAQFGWVSSTVSASLSPYVVCFQYFTA